MTTTDYEQITFVDSSLDGMLAEMQSETLEPVIVFPSPSKASVSGFMDLVEHGYEGVENV